jgi:hypothetical protein
LRPLAAAAPAWLAVCTPKLFPGHPKYYVR